MNTVLYNGVGSAGLDGSTAYLTANLEFVSLEYLLAKNQQVDLCDESWVTPIENYGQDANDAADGGGRRRLDDGANDANQNAAADCDLADGYYAFSLQYTLPDYQDSMSWLATGWKGTGYVKMYSDDTGMDESLIGSCKFKFDTMVTQNNAGGMKIPTAAMTLAILAGVFALGGFLCCYMSCCRRNKQKQAATPSDTTVGATSYKRTEDDGTFISSKVGSVGSKV